MNDKFLNLALSKYNNGEFVESISLFKKSLALKETWQTYQVLGTALLNIGHYQQAVDALKKSLALNETWQTYQVLGIGFYNIGQYQPSVDALKKSLALKDDWQSYQVLGRALFNIGHYQPTVDAFKKSLALKDDWQSYQGLGIALLNIGHYQQAVDALKKSLALKEDWQSYQGLGIAFFNIGHHQQAVDALKKSLALNENWKSYQGLGRGLFNIGQYRPSVDALKKSLALKETWQSYQGLGIAFLNIGHHQQAVDALKKSLALNENWYSYQGLGQALDKLGKDDEGVKAFQKYYQLGGLHPHIKTCPFLGQKGGISATRDLIENIIEDLSKFQFAFHPSYLSETEENNHLQSWKNLIHIHIPKCAGTNFERPLSKLPSLLNKQLPGNSPIWGTDPQYMQYLWSGNLGGKCNHDAFIVEAFRGNKINNIQGSFLPNIGAPHRIYCQKLLDMDIPVRKICLVRDPSQRLYSHIKDFGHASYNKSDLLNRCAKEFKNVMDRHIYDYDLYEGRHESPYCQPTDYDNCESIDFLDISDDNLISRVKSSFLSASKMPNIVQYNRLNDNSSRIIDGNGLGEKDFRDVHTELIHRGYLGRDNQIDLEFLRKNTIERLVFPEIIHTGTELHPITFVYPKSGIPRFMLTKDFIANPLNSIYI